MKLTRLATAAIVLLLAPAVFGQDDQPIPVPPNTPLHILHASPSMLRNDAAVAPPAALSIPTFNYSEVSPIDGLTYTGQIVGADPGARPAHPVIVPTAIVPVKLVFKFSSTSSFTFDPMAGDPGCIGSGHTALGLTEQSPLFNDHSYTFGTTNVGNTQFLDAFQRANFWSKVLVSGGANVHTLFGITPMPEQTVTVTSSGTGTTSGAVFSFTGQCGTNTGTTNGAGLLGVMDINFWDAHAQTIMTSLGISPNTFVLFLFYNTYMSNCPPATNLGNCCIFGYHNIVGSQTYGNSVFDGRNQTLATGVADISVLTHELGEWLNDPTVGNPTPAWGHIGQVSGCQGNFEVGDPLTGTLMPNVAMNGFTYHQQELAFFNWFYRNSPSNAVNGWFSSNNTLTTDAGPVCH